MYTKPTYLHSGANATVTVTVALTQMVLDPFYH